MTTNEDIQDQKINRILADNCGYESVNEWILGMGLGQYYDLFIENGYDSFRICSEIQKIDIETIGIRNQFHASILIKGVAKMNNPKSQSVYHRLSVCTPDDNENKSIASELNITPPTQTEHKLTNGCDPSKLTEDFYKKKPSLLEKRSVRTLLVQLKIDLSEPIYEENSRSLDGLAEQISQQLTMEELSVYDILCLLRRMAVDNNSPRPNKLPIQLPNNVIPNGDPTSVSSPGENVFSSPDSFTPLSPDPVTTNIQSKPPKPPRLFTNPEDKSLIPLANGESSLPISNSISSNSVSVTDVAAGCPYDILRADSVEPQIVSTSNVKSPAKKTTTKHEDPLTPPPPPPPASNAVIEEALYIELDGSIITENNIGSTPKVKQFTNNIFKKSKSHPKKVQDDQNLFKKPPNQPPPPPPASSTQETDPLSKVKTSKAYKRDTKDDTDINGSTTVNEAKSKKQSGFFKKSTKPKTDSKGRHKKSKDESDLISNMRVVEEVGSLKRLSKNLSKSSDNLLAPTISEDLNCSEEDNNWSGKQIKQQGFARFSPEATSEFQRKLLSSSDHQFTKIIQVDVDESSNPMRSLPPNPIPRRRNSPDEIFTQPSNDIPKTQQPIEVHTLPRNQGSENKAQPPKKPKRNISADILYDNVEQAIPNPVPRVRKLDSPPLTKKFDLPPITFPQRASSISSRPQMKISNDMKQPQAGKDTSSIARNKPEVPKGKKPILKSKPVLDGSQIKREKVSREPQPRDNQLKQENVITRMTSPLTAPPLPTTKRPATPSNSNQPPETPPIHSIPSMKPIAHVRPTKPPIITRPSATSSNPIAEPRNIDNWKKIEDKITSILIEEDFLDYLVTHYTGENGESDITPGLVCRLANETSFAIHHIASALDNIRIQRLTELGRNAIPISLAEFDEIETPTHIDNISTWLTSIGLPNYIEVFYENIKEAKEIKNLDADDLSEFCVSTKHRGCLLHAIDLLQ
ncbi:Sterile alpha motif domain-containing protein 5-like [Oopsacas minuta]|uniref:Sterile alpha motif domain-containing protein 5-like n=1 Tax=Oopsacas minuta TaxID=111878 RepID=A0AAV7KDH1_9METZ|nr:Sterile alpha motif domain-containing protein 5-like [Oopsacas minuta]